MEAKDWVSSVGSFLGHLGSELGSRSSSVFNRPNTKMVSPDELARKLVSLPPAQEKIDLEMDAGSSAYS